MPFLYDQQLIDNALTYRAYRQGINDALAQPAASEAAEKMRPYILKHVALMERYDEMYTVSSDLKTVLEAAPPTTWLVLTEGWCGDAAFNVPMMAAIEKAVPAKVQLRLLLRDNHPELMDAHLTNGGRSIPILIVLNNELQELGTWGPRPAPLQTLMKVWKAEGLVLKELIPKVQEWYDADATRSIQEELVTLITNYS